MFHLQCAACHRHPTLRSSETNAAPNPRGEGTRVKRAWLLAYLRKPAAIRPFGHRPGGGGRMPDFRLSEGEAGDLAAFLWTQAVTEPGGSPVARHYATYCAGCHGETGQGDGFNARYLPVKPTRHADGAYLSTRPDDTCVGCKWTRRASDVELVVPLFLKPLFYGRIRLRARSSPEIPEVTPRSVAQLRWVIEMDPEIKTRG